MDDLTRLTVAGLNARLDTATFAIGAQLRGLKMLEDEFDRIKAELAGRRRQVAESAESAQTQASEHKLPYQTSAESPTCTGMFSEGGE